MANYRDSFMYNQSGAFDPTAAAVLGPDNEDFAKYITNCVLGPIKLVKHSAWGQLKYINRKQYIRDKLCMIRDEFLATPTEDDINYVCHHCFTRESIDIYCRGIIGRAYDRT